MNYLKILKPIFNIFQINFLVLNNYFSNKLFNIKYFNLYSRYLFGPNDGNSFSDPNSKLNFTGLVSLNTILCSLI